MLKIHDYVKALQGPQFTCCNYGDGEWSCILGKKGRNVQNRGVYYPDLGEALAQTILIPKFTAFGYNAGGVRGEAEVWLRDQGVDVPILSDFGIDIKRGGLEIPWVHKEVVSSANVRGRFGPLLKQLRRMDVLLVGGPHLESLDLLEASEFALYRFFPCLPTNSWLRREQIGARVMAIINEKRLDIVLLCCGMFSNVLAYDLLERGCECHILDMGACFDPYVGVVSRSGYEGANFPAALRKNLEEGGVFT